MATYRMHTSSKVKPIYHSVASKSLPVKVSGKYYTLAGQPAQSSSMATVAKQRPGIRLPGVRLPSLSPVPALILIYFGWYVLRNWSDIFDTINDRTATENYDEYKKLLYNNAKGISATQSKLFWAQKAEELFTALKNYSFFDSPMNAKNILELVNNDADIFFLYDSFGTRSEVGWFKDDSPLNLNQFVIQNLSVFMVDDVNDLYQKRNMKFRF